MEGDDDAGGREVPAVHQQGASGEGKAGDNVRPLGAKQTSGAGTKGIAVVTNMD